MTEFQSTELSASALAEPVLHGAIDGSEVVRCFHCGTRYSEDKYRHEEHTFCCSGCLAVFELLAENGLTDFYALDSRAGVRIKSKPSSERFSYLDEPGVRAKIVNYSDEQLTRVTFRLPAIHCIACVWLLENLFRLKEGIGQTQVNFLRKEAIIDFHPAKVELSELVALLASLGYEPDLKLADLEQSSDGRAGTTPRKLWMQLGIAGFAFGNNMLFSIAIYLGLDAFHGPAMQKLVGYISMLLALPVLLYSAQDYFKLAWTGLKHRLLTIEVPIAAGILVIFGQSAFEVISGTGEGYFDSFAGLLFFLLCGRLFQQKTYSRLAFDRDFKSFFPLSITRVNGRTEESISLSHLSVGDKLLIRNGELVPADSELISGEGFIDYSFVTGEAQPVEKIEGESIYAGGRQMGGAIKVQVIKPVSQSYLTSLWNQDAFTKSSKESLDTLINCYSQRFTKVILVIAVGAAVYWSFVQPSIAIKALTSVLIVACPCALALAAPFTMGTAMRVLARKNVFIKNAEVLERFAKVQSIVFDKTGTLTAAGAASVHFEGSVLTATESALVFSLARHSTHPYAVRISESIAAGSGEIEVRSFVEVPGCGIEANVGGFEVALGSAEWIRGKIGTIPGKVTVKGSNVHLAINSKYRGAFVLAHAMRPQVEILIPRLGSYEISLLSGDNESERNSFAALFGPAAQLRFNQSPADKLEYIRALQREGKVVMMVGDGLNDAGALKQSDVGIAVVESVGAFSPASDVIAGAEVVPKLDSVLSFSRQAVRVVRFSFLLSSIYNVVGIAIAAMGLLAPIVCAILMPLSSISVVAFACIATSWLGYRASFSNAVTHVFSK